jgi:hypothetical protein
MNKDLGSRARELTKTIHGLRTYEVILSSLTKEYKS